MLKRVLLAFTFVAVLAAAGFGMSNKAMAWNDCNNGYGYAYPTYYPSYPSFYVPRVATYRSYPVFYGSFDNGHHHHDHHRSGLRLTFGF